MKKSLALLLAIVMALSLAACSSGSPADTSDLEARIKELESENLQLKNQLEEFQLKPQSTETPEPAGEPSSSIMLGETYTIPDLCEFTINSADLKKEVMPPNPGSFYTYYKEEDGKTYIDVSVSIKNLRTTARTADEFGVVTAICGEGYEYTAFSAIEESDGSNFTYTNITDIDPLTTGVIHYLIKIPNEIADDESIGIVLNITILDSDYMLVVR